jgi:hypothetical protein
MIAEAIEDFYFDFESSVRISLTSETLWWNSADVPEVVETTDTLVEVIATKFVFEGTRSSHFSGVVLTVHY